MLILLCYVYERFRKIEKYYLRGKRECIRGARNYLSWSKVWGKIEKLARSVDATMNKLRTTRVQENAAPKDQTPLDYSQIYFLFIETL